MPARRAAPGTRTAAAAERGRGIIARMLCARATLTAGPDHKRFKAGTAVRALVFVRDARDPGELTRADFGPITARGWKHVRIDGHRLLPDDHAFPPGGRDEATAFASALERGIGVLVLGVLQ